MTLGSITVELVYATRAKVETRRVALRAGASVADAIAASGIEACVGTNFDALKVGIFGRLCSRSERVNDGDRIEIYRPLTVEPNQARLRRAAKKEAQKKVQKR